MKNHRLRSSALSLALVGAFTTAACGSGGAGGAAASGDCVAGTVNAAGPRAQKKLIDAWGHGYSVQCERAVLKYDPAGSDEAVQAFLRGQVAFAVSKSPLTPEELGPARLRCAGNEALSLPVAVGPVGFVDNYVIVCEKGLAPEQAKFVKGFLIHTVSDGGRAELAKTGYADVPSSVLSRVRTSVASLS